MDGGLDVSISATSVPAADGTKRSAETRRRLRFLFFFCFFLFFFPHTSNARLRRRRLIGNGGGGCHRVKKKRTKKKRASASLTFRSRSSHSTQRWLDASDGSGSAKEEGLKDWRGQRKKKKNLHLPLLPTEHKKITCIFVYTFVSQSFLLS